MEKKTIRIKFVDTWPTFDEKNNIYISIISKFFNVEFSDNPDYLFYSCFGNEYLKYKCVRIFFTGECITPDFNLCDYAIGFDRLSFEDRYCRVPLYYWNYSSQYKKAKQNTNYDNSLLPHKRDFCCMVVSNGNGQKERKEIFDLLSAYKPVASGGRWMNNIGGPVKDKVEFCSHYKFSIAFENCNYSGYTTEKIVEAFAAGTVPIYYGDPNIENEFNPKAFVNCAAFPSLEDAVEYVKYLDTHDDAYEAMLREPMEISEKNFGLETFLCHIFSQEYDMARRRPANVWVDEIEKNVNRAMKEQNREKNGLQHLMFRIKRKINHVMHRI